MPVQLTPNARIDHYTLEECLGSGASGEVWRASDGIRPVAVKFTNANLLVGSHVDKHRQRLITEIRALELLVACPNIPRLYGYDLHFERPYLVMEYIATSAHDLMISSGMMMQIKLTQRLNMLKSLAATITKMHETGIIHRDIKPHNITGIEKPYLLDFSIALEKWQAHEADPHVGTAIYMAPLDGYAPDELSDNYSFAVVAYEVLFGRHPIFTADNIGATITQTCNRAREYVDKQLWHRPTQLPDVPVNMRGADLVFLDDIFQRALGSRSLRYTDLNIFVEDLKSAIIVPENLPFLDCIEAAAPKTVPKEAGYTNHEVENAARITQHEPAEQKRRRRWKFWSSKQA